MNLIPWRRKREEERPREASSTAMAPFREEVDSLFNRFLRDPWDFGPWFSPLEGLTSGPCTDLAETENEVSVKMELPGMDPKEIDIDITGNLLTVRGEKKHEQKEKRKDYHYTERRFGSFQRSVQLPASVNTGDVKADYKAGVLHITIGKNPEAKPRRIQVRSG